MKNAIRERKSKVLGLFLCFLLLGIDYSFASYNNYSQFKTLSVSMSNSTLREVLKTIEKSSQFVFFYLDDAVNLERKVSIDSKNKNIEEILSELFEGTSCTYRISDRQIFISGKAPASTEQQQNKRKISGRVTDIKGEPLIGVNVTVDGDANGSITNMDGLYEIFVTKKSVVLKFTYIGFKTSEIRTNASTNIYDVTLEEQVNELEETVIVGYGTQRKISNIGAQSSMKMEDIKTPSASLTTTLAGRLAGVVAVQRTGEPGKDAADIWIRGISTPNTSSPLVLVDGVERSFNDIDPEDIESLTTLKDASATAVYGVRGANGVILIKTKPGKVGKPTVSADYYESFTRFTKMVDLADGITYMNAANEAMRNDGIATKYTEDQIRNTIAGKDPYLYPNVDWLKEIFNDWGHNRRVNPEKGHKFMPYIVVVIDEFGDLIMTAGKEVELPIARIAQLARAVGIHMIIATQRPTTNIITGTIKANFPARIAFRVSAMMDSRTILDRPGANRLIGKGDMLFLQGADPVRVQCAFIDTPEVEEITKFIARQQGYPTPFFLPEYVSEDSNSEVGDIDMGRLDPLFEDAARLVVIHQQGSTSLIQRKFAIGYNRAGRIMDQLEKAGIVGPTQGSKARDVLCIDDNDLEMRLNNLQ